MRSNNRAYYSRTAQGEPSCLGMGAMRTLAVLLLTDGRIVPCREIGVLSLPWGGSQASVPHWIKLLRTYGCRIETVSPHGVRLAALPPDDLLEDVLVIAHELRAEQPTRLWLRMGLEARPLTRMERQAARRAEVGCLTRMTA